MKHDPNSPSWDDLLGWFSMPYWYGLFGSRTPNMIAIILLDHSRIRAEMKKPMEQILSELKNGPGPNDAPDVNSSCFQVRFLKGKWTSQPCIHPFCDIFDPERSEGCHSFFRVTGVFLPSGMKATSLHSGWYTIYRIIYCGNDEVCIGHSPIHC